MIGKTIDTLNSYGLQEHHINLPVAVAEATRILDDISRRAAHENRTNREPTRGPFGVEFWEDFLAVLPNEVIEVQQLKHNTITLQSRLDDAAHLAHLTNHKLDEAVNINTDNLRRYNALANRQQLARQLRDDTYAVFNTSVVPRADLILEEVEDTRQKVYSDIRQIVFLKDTIDGGNAELTNELRTIAGGIMPMAEKHAAGLMRRAKEYEREFQSTKDGAELAMRARYISRYFYSGKIIINCPF